MHESKKVLKRKVDINGREFTVFGEAPWIVISAKEENRYIIVEASLLSFATLRPTMYNAVSTVATNGANIGVVFAGESGKKTAEEVVRKLNFKF